MSHGIRLTAKAALFAAAVSTAASVSHAAVVTWTLQDVRFEDGGTASGFFMVDTDNLGLIPDFDIKTTTGATGFGGAEYLSFQHWDQIALYPLPSEGSWATQGYSSYVADQVRFSGGLHGPILDLWLPTTAFSGITSGTFPLLIGPDLSYNGSGEFHWNDGASRWATAGNVNAIPEPFILAFLGIGTVLLGLSRKRKAK